MQIPVPGVSEQSVTVSVALPLQHHNGPPVLHLAREVQALKIVVGGFAIVTPTAQQVAVTQLFEQHSGFELQPL